MQPQFWHDRWRLGQIGFHQAAADSSLTRLWSTLDLPPGSRVFVPLCGKTLDLLWLRDQGHEVLGVELSDLAVQAFCAENGVPARRRVLADADLYEAPGLTLLRADLFAVTAGQLGHIDAVYDRAALIAWEPSQRAAYARHLTALTRPGTPTLLITLEYPAGQIAGPPFPVTAGEVEALYGAQHRIEQLSRRDILAADARMRQRGVTELIETVYRLVRR